MLTRHTNAQGVEYALDYPDVYEIVKLDELLAPKSEKLIITNTFKEKFKLGFNGDLFDFQKIPLFSNSQKLKLTNQNCAAYLIVCHKENCFYIGSSSKVANRFRGHRNRLTSGINASRNLLEVFQRTSKEDFQVIVLDCASKESAFELEQSLMDYFKGDTRKLNISEDAKDSSKFIPTAEAKLKRKLVMSEKMKLVHADPEYKERLRAKLIEAYKNPEVLERYTETVKARFADPVFREKYDANMREKVWSNPQALAARQAGTQRMHADPIAKKKRQDKANATYSTPEYRKKISEIASLRMSTPEARQAHSEKLKAHYANDDNRTRAFEANKHLAKPVKIDGVVYQSMHDASKHFKMSRPGVKFRIEHTGPKFASWAYA